MVQRIVLLHKTNNYNFGLSSVNKQRVTSKYLSMSTSNMVADSKTEKKDMKDLPMFDSTNVVNWSKRLRMWLMRRNRNHLGLDERPEPPPPGTTAAVRLEFKHDVAAWLERKDTCVSSIYEAVQSVPEALEIVEQYMVEKEILLAGDPNKKVLASELVERLMGRFRGKI